MPRSPRKTRKRPKARRGYVLVMTLVILGLAVATLARIAEHSLTLAQTARSRAVELQSKWTVLSCRLRLIEPAERVLGDHAAAMEQQGLGWPHPSGIVGEFELGGAACRYVVADEQAKANLNTIYQERPDQVTALLAVAMQESGSRVPVRLRPKLSPTPMTSHRSFDNWGSVVDLAGLASQAGGAEDLIACSSGLTCWGDGRVNITRATDEQLLPVLRLELTGEESQRLLDARRGYTGELGALLDSVELPRRKLTKLRRRLTDRSSCYALWLVTSTHQQERLTVVVHEAGRRQGPESQVFQWP